MLKQAHVTLAAVSLAGFVLRWSGNQRGWTWLRRRWVRALPHVLDTALLLTGVALAWRLQQLPPTLAWLQVKLVGLVVYIVLGYAALRAPRGRVALFVAAVAVFAWMVSVAGERDALGFIGTLVG